MSDSHQPHVSFNPTARLYSFEVSFQRYCIDVRLRVLSVAGVIGIEILINSTDDDDDVIIDILLNDTM